MSLRVLPGRGRALHTSATALAKPRRQQRTDPFTLNNMGRFAFDDVPTVEHVRIRKQREVLNYCRVLRHEVPKLAQFAEPFTPPPASAILRFRFAHYQGEEHPDARKVSATVSIKELFASGALKTTMAKHKFLLLAGPRWAVPHADIVNRLNDARTKGEKELEQAFKTVNLGKFKISSGDLPNESQNFKWCSDKIDAMIAEANSEPSFADVPLDSRHITASSSRGGQLPRATINNYPKEWL
ncbi:37S ribosomal protein S24, mitochondrial [Malassezia cuniculi]|uniref:37S ribosomal protein S24, mitochondrial n=1 Tax=Malassezia cuniculi TaxID=948313 RepID=A0AAF0ESX3_9BASI|nr:37S ribosomal protein S24, mitochondrial [Malassezia cuniculi]